MRASDFHREQGAAATAGDTEAGATRLSALNPSLVQDLRRFESAHPPGEGLDLLEVLAASLRHGRALLLHLQHDWQVFPLVLLPATREVQCAMPLPQLMALPLPELRVLRVEPAAADGPAADLPAAQPLCPLAWELALRGARAALLPEIAGVATYRVTPGARLTGIDLVGSLAHAVTRLRRETTPAHELARWPSFDADRAARLLNALYLQSALMVSRSHPGAVRGL